MSVEAAVIDYLNAGIDAEVYPHSRPQGSPLPAVTVRRISGGPLYADDGEVGLIYARLQIESWGTTYTTSKNTAVATLARLSAVADVLQSGVTIRYITMEDEQDLRDPGNEDFEYLFHVRQDYTVWAVF